MCGLAGILERTPRSGADGLASAVRAMTDSIRHRGPDDDGHWCDAAAGVALGHRRLSIIDLSQAGHQPMVSADGRWVVALNGEIYNFQELRGRLDGYPFKGHSDTEVATAAFSQWGIEAALERFVGMFAFAVWDREERCLYLARDRLGEKPLYYGEAGGNLVFGSELKALRAYPAWRGEVDRRALGLLLQHTYIPAPLSIYANVRKLLPGAWLKVSAGDTLAELEPQSYWNPEAMVRGATTRPRGGDLAGATEELDALLRATIRDKMIADVPLGAFLSGGIDSSLVVGLMQAESTKPVKTFSIGFNEEGYDEAVHARRVAEHLGTEHTELYVTPTEARAVIPDIPQLYDEPFADSSQIPTFLVSQLARHHVTVALSGDGGDELFGGYSRYQIAQDLWNPVARVPAPLRRTGAALVGRVPPRLIDRAARPFRKHLPRDWQQRSLGHALHRRAALWKNASRDSIYRRQLTLWDPVERVVNGIERPDMLARFQATLGGFESYAEQMMFTDMVTYLPDDILVKVDRASMGVSLEVRVPFLDHRVVEHAWQVAPDLKTSGGVGKRVLREVLYRYVPRELVERPKMGFGVPIDEWLKGPLREWAEDLLDPRRLAEEGYFQPQPIREKWQAHLEGRGSWHYLLWPVLMFQAWQRHGAV